MVNVNPHLLMRGPCEPRKTLSGVCSVVIGIPERTVYLIVHNTEALPLWIHDFVFGVRADPADYKLVTFFVKADEG